MKLFPSKTAILMPPSSSVGSSRVYDLTHILSRTGNHRSSARLKVQVDQWSPTSSFLSRFANCIVISICFNLPHQGLGIEFATTAQRTDFTIGAAGVFDPDDAGSPTSDIVAFELVLDQSVDWAQLDGLTKASVEIHIRSAIPGAGLSSDGFGVLVKQSSIPYGSHTVAPGLSSDLIVERFLAERGGGPIGGFFHYDESTTALKTLVTDMGVDG